VSQRIKAI